MPTHDGRCHSGDGHRTLVISLTVDEADYDFMDRYLTAVIAGVYEPSIDDRSACSYFGPFEVPKGTSLDIFQALADEGEGRFEDESAEEPQYVREKLLLKAIREHWRASDDLIDYDSLTERWRKGVVAAREAEPQPA